MKDRTSKYPGRVRLVPVAGQANVYDMAWADEPQQIGTPLNKASLLSDVVAAALRLSQDDPTVNDAFMGIVQGFAQVTVSSRLPTSSDAGYPGHMWLIASGTGYSLWICTANSSGVATWQYLISVQRKLKSAIIRNSTTWTVPDNLVGDARVMVFGGGGSGAQVYSSNRSGAGGGGGHMAEWIGPLTPGASIEVTIGKGGAGVNSTKGNAGGTTSFGTLVSAAGGSGANYTAGGDGGSGGGSGDPKSTTAAEGGRGSQFGNGGSIGETTSTSATDGTDTSTLEVDNLGKGTGKAGTNAPANAPSIGGAAGGGGFGGNGGNGVSGSSSVPAGGGGGGGFGASGNGGNGGGNSGGIAAGGGGTSSGTSGSGGDGIIMIMYYAMEATL